MNSIPYAAKEVIFLRIAVISDVHSNFVAFEAVAQDLKKTSPDAVVYLGDLVMKGPQPNECIDLLRSLEPSHIVRGNYDHLFTRFPRPGWEPKNNKESVIAADFDYHKGLLSDADQSWLANLPTSATLTVGDVHFELYHAAPDSLNKITWPWASIEELLALFASEKTDVLLFGHIHHSFVRHTRGRLIVNPGSIGLPFDGDPRASYAVVDLEGNHIASQIRRVPYDIDRAVEVARKSDMPAVDLYESALREAKYPEY